MAEKDYKRDHLLSGLRESLPIDVSMKGSAWQPIETAPKDGSAVLGFGLHSGPQPDAQRGVKAGDYWWAIMLWDVWRNPDAGGWGEKSLWVFAKDGKPTWSHPSHWMPLPDPPESK